MIGYVSDIYVKCFFICMYMTLSVSITYELKSMKQAFSILGNELVVYRS